MSRPILWVASGTTDPPPVAEEVELHTDAAAAAERAGWLLTAGTPAGAIVIDAATLPPVATAKRVRRADPHVALVLLTTEVATLSRNLRLVPEVPHARVVAADTSVAELRTVVDEARDQADRARQLRSALDRINRTMEQRSPADAVPLFEGASQRYLAALLDHAPDAILSVDLDGRVVTANEATTRVLGVGLPELERRSVDELVVPRDVDRFQRLLASALRGQEVNAADVHLQGSDTLVIAAVTAAPIVDLAGATTGAVVMARDVTEARQSEQRLRDLQRAESLATLAGGVAHDFNNLLQTIVTWSELAEDTLHDPIATREALKSIQQSAGRATELARQMLAYSGRHRVEFETVDVNDVIAEMARLVVSSIHRKTEFVTHFDDDVPPVTGDPTQLQQVVLNLVTNASEALEGESGVVELRTSSTLAEAATTGHLHGHELRHGQRYVVLDVTDTGPGIGPSMLPRIFEPFFTTKFTGRGLGLAATLGIVRAHGGAVLIDSPAGRGARFRVLLPAADGAPEGFG